MGGKHDITPLAIKLLRNQRGWSQEDLARECRVRLAAKRSKIKVPAGTIASIEAGRGGGPTTLSVLEDIFGDALGLIRDPNGERQEWRLRSIIESWILEHHLSQADLTKPAELLGRLNRLLGAVAEVNNSITTAVREVMTERPLRPKRFDALLSNIDAAAFNHERLAGGGTDPHCYAASRHYHEAGKLFAAEALVYRSRMACVGSHSTEKRELRRDAERCFRRAHENFAESLKSKKPTVEPAAVIPTRLRVLELQLEEMLLRVAELDPGDFDDLIEQVEMSEAEARRDLPKSARREDLKANHRYVVGKIYYCKSRRIEAPDHEWDDCLTKSELCCFYGMNLKAIDDPEGRFWATALLARCSLERFARTRSEEKEDIARYMHARVLSREARSHVRTLRGALMVWWLERELLRHLGSREWVTDLLGTGARRPSPPSQSSALLP